MELEWAGLVDTLQDLTYDNNIHITDDHIWWLEHDFIADPFSEFVVLRRAGLDGIGATNAAQSEVFGRLAGRYGIEQMCIYPSGSGVTNQNLGVIDISNPGSPALSEKTSPFRRPVTDLATVSVVVSDTKIVRLMQETSATRLGTYALMSDDSGDTWTDHDIDSTVNGDTLISLRSGLAVDPDDDQHLWAVGIVPGQVYESTNGGVLWNAVAVDGLMTAPNGIVITGDHQPVVASGGALWKRSTLGVWSQTFDHALDVFEFMVHPITTTLVLVSVRGVGTTSAAYVSTDGGATFGAAINQGSLTSLATELTVQASFSPTSYLYSSMYHPFYGTTFHVHRALLEFGSLAYRTAANPSVRAVHRTTF